MTLSNVTKVFAIKDAAVASMTADLTTAPTYGSLVDVPGIKKVGLSFDMKNVELRGDNKRLDSDTILIGCKVTFDHAKLSLDALPIFIGGAAATASGTTPNQVTKYKRVSTDSMPYFFMGAKTPVGGTDAATTGSVMLQIFKLKVDKYDLGFAEEDYQTFSGEASGVFPISSDTLFQLALYETDAAITTAL